jgi:hypothetical protein
VRRGGINREGLAVVLPVMDGKAARVGEALGKLGTRQASPFARIRSTHFARLVLIEHFPGLHKNQTLPGVPACVFFAAEFDITVSGYIEALCTLMPKEADSVFELCAGYPGVRVPPLLEEWMERHRVKAGFSLHGNPKAHVRQVVGSLELRERIIRFALDTRSLEPAALRKAWDAEDWERAA